jgi:hypothetical protein
MTYFFGLKTKFFIMMQTLDAAVGDTSIVAYRYHLVDFSQPYVESGLHMVVTEQPAKSKTWKFLDAFTKEMWLMMIAMHVFVGFVIWVIEREVNEDLRGFGSMLWFLVTVLFYAHSKSSYMICLSIFISINFILPSF